MELWYWNHHHPFNREKVNGTGTFSAALVTVSNLFFAAGPTIVITKHD
jgi:hypothetical protein